MYDVAIVGATGAVGECLIELLAARDFPVASLHLLASEESVGKRLAFREQQLPVKSIETFDFSTVQIAFFSAGSLISSLYVPKAAAAGCISIDNTAHFRYETDVPLVVPEVNPDAIAGYRERMIIANPNCSTIQMLVALKPIYDAVGIDRINVATYQSVSGAGRQAIEALARQTAQLLNGQEATDETHVFARQMAFNVIPQIDTFLENGYTKEEMKMVWETQKIFGDPDIRVNATAVRVPVFYGHSEAVHIETREAISTEEAKRLLRDAPGVVLLEDDAEFPTVVSHASGTDAVYVGRVRQDISHPFGLNMWIVADNVRKGAALNAIQIAELLPRYMDSSVFGFM